MASAAIRTGVVGATGYTGAELARLLSGHPHFDLNFLSSRKNAGEDFTRLYPRFQDEIELQLEHPDRLSEADLELLFLAVPHTISMQIVPQIDLESTVVVDLAADYRFPSVPDFNATYETEHTDVANNKKAVYGLTEHNREKIAAAALVANPGCYATAALLPLITLVQEDLVVEPFFIDAKSGISGAGRKPSATTTFVARNEDIWPYKVGEHRHQAEIAAHLPDSELEPFFVPHVIPVDRGIEAALYCRTASSADFSRIEASLKRFCAQHRLLRYRSEPAGIKSVANTPYCDITVIEKDGRLVVFSCLDNLLKGAASQAIQNANLVFDFDSSTGLIRR